VYIGYNVKTSWTCRTDEAPHVENDVGHMLDGFGRMLDGFGRLILRYDRLLSFLLKSHQNTLLS